MKAVSARKRSKYDELVYERAGVQKWLAENFAELRGSDTIKIVKNRFFFTYFTRKTLVEYVPICCKALFIFDLRIYTKHR